MRGFLDFVGVATLAPHAMRPISEHGEANEVGLDAIRPTLNEGRDGCLVSCNVQDRGMGSLAACNVMFLVVPATRNNLLTFLLGLPFDYTILYHRFLGRFAIGLVVIHMLLYASPFHAVPPRKPPTPTTHLRTHPRGGHGAHAPLPRPRANRKRSDSAGCAVVVIAVVVIAAIAVIAVIAVIVVAVCPVGADQSPRCRTVTHPQRWTAAGTPTV